MAGENVPGRKQMDTLGIEPNTSRKPFDPIYAKRA